MKLYKSHQQNKEINQKIEKDKESIPELNTDNTIIIYETTDFMKFIKRLFRNIISGIIFILIAVIISFGIAYCVTHLF